MEPIQKLNEVPGDPPCSFCKSGREVSTYIFTNPARDCFVCNVCVVRLATTLVEVAELEAIPADTKAN